MNTFHGVEIVNEPYGVVLIFSPWNYPVLLSLTPLIGALAAGNCVVLQLSRNAPATSQFLEAELKNCIDEEIIFIFKSEYQELLKERFDYIFFTGSVSTGRLVYQAAAKNFTPTTLELGGKNPTYLDDSANINLATRRILWGKILNSGQTCLSPDYLLCNVRVQEKFLKSATRILQEFFKEDLSGISNLSKIVTEESFKRLLTYLESGKIAIGGQFMKEDRIIYPTVLIDVKDTDPVMADEVFGPILPILNVENCDKAIEFIRKREKPLAIYVFSNNKRIQKRFLKETSSGSVAINDTIMQITTENLPFGGVGSSGIGRYHGEHSFNSFSHQKAVLKTPLNRFMECFLESRYPPYSTKKTNVVRFLMKRRKMIMMKIMQKIVIFLFGFVTAVILCALYVFFIF